MHRIPVLVATGGPLRGARFRITESGLNLGRDPDCAVHIDDPAISRQHARVLLHNAAVWVQDAGSRNGVFVNGRRVVRPVQLGPGDELTLGEHTFTIEVAAPEEDEPDTSPGDAREAGVELEPTLAAPPERGGRWSPALLAVAVALAAVAAAWLLSFVD